MAVLLAPASRFILEWLFDASYDWSLVFVLCAVGTLRLLYVLPSAILGAFSTPKVLAGFGAMGFVGLAVQMLVTLFAAPGGLMMAAALGLAAATLLRVITSSVICIRLVHRHRAPETGEPCPV